MAFVAEKTIILYVDQERSGDHLPDNLHAFHVSFLTRCFEVELEEGIFLLHDAPVAFGRVVIHTDEPVYKVNILKVLDERVQGLHKEI